MPELPEVETSRLGIAPYIQQQKITAIIVRNSKLRWPVPVAEIQTLIGQTISRVERRGKYLKLVCDQGYLLVHLGMSGSLRILPAGEQPGKHDHIDLQVTGNVILRYNDPRRFGCWLYQVDNSVEHKLLASLGIEPLGEEFSAEYLYLRSRGKSQAIKTFIMNSHIVVGVGNIYAAESLFLAGIHPKTKAGKISLKRYEKLVAAIRQVLADAIQQGGTTLRDFVNSDGKPGYFQQQLYVYGREDTDCNICCAPIKKIKQGSRSTFYCPKCQK